jgi:hypothetical protein
MLILLLVGVLACSDDTEEPTEPSSAPSLTVTGHTGCKNAVTKRAGADSTRECIEWQYDDEGALHIHHVNAGFNCCVDALLASFDKEGNSITITESEDLENGGCHCLCLYDLDYEISYLATGEYYITVIGPCMESQSTPESDYIVFSVDLATEPTGTFCVRRDHYPWQ